jgi:hypothetical protein
MKIGRSFGLVFKTQGALRKLLRGGLFTSLFFTVFFAFVVMGYLIRLMCELLEGRDTKLPEWHDLRELFYDGLQPVLISLIYLSPVISLAILELYVNATYIYVAQILLALIVSGILPLALIHFVTARAIPAAFSCHIIFSFMMKNFRRVVQAWLIHVGLAICNVLIGGIILLLIAVPISLATTVRIGAFVGFIFGAVAFCFGLFAIAAIGTHIWARMYRASTPFEDDSEGRIRSSIVVPPSLNAKEK